jgi:hypothetical protein
MIPSGSINMKKAEFLIFMIKIKKRETKVIKPPVTIHIKSGISDKIIFILNYI